MKIKYKNSEVVYKSFKRGKKEDCPVWLDYDKLWEWFDTWFKRMGYSDGFYRSCQEEENEKLLEKKKKSKFRN